MRALIALLMFGACSFAAEPAKIGEAVPKLKFTDTRSLPRTLDDFGAKKAIVIAFIDTSCPVAQRYLPTLKDLAKEYKDVQFLALNSNGDDSVVAVALQAVRHDIDFPFGKDFGGECAKALGVTPDAFIQEPTDRPPAGRGRPRAPAEEPPSPPAPSPDPSEEKPKRRKEK